MADQSSISSFYSNKKILITGGTGSMGKVLIWKLLNSCPALDIIYVLMRPKHDKNPISRKEELLNLPIFNNFKDDPKIFDKVVLVTGDIAAEKLGLSEEDRDMLIEEVSIIFHSAAILKMDSDLRTAVNVNTLGTVRMLDLAQNMKKLETFVHVSTAFCCCENLTVEEKIYPSKHNPYDIIEMVKWMEPELLKDITPKLIYPLPNTYIYTKRLTEVLLLDYASKVPIIVARPSIVIPSLKEPIPGFADNLNGPIGLFVAGGKGVMRVSMMNIDAHTDVIPVDIAINSIIVLPWAHRKEQLLKEMKIYNISQTGHEHMTWRKAIMLFKNAFYKYPYEKIIWNSSYENIFTQNIFVYMIKCIFFHYIPAYILDFLLMLVGKKPFLVRTHTKLSQGEKVLRYFTHRQWKFVHDNLLQLENFLNDTDKQIFPINMERWIDYQDYANKAIIGTKLFIFNEDMNNLDGAKRTAKIMYYVDKTTLLLRYYVLWKVLVFIFNIVVDIFHA